MSQEKILDSQSLIIPSAQVRLRVNLYPTKTTSKEFLVTGRPSSRPQLYYNVPVPGERPLIGGHFFMESVNKALVQRTFGLLELEARTSNTKEAQMDRYGPDFAYKEFMVMPSVFAAASFTVVFFIGLLLVAFPPVWNRRLCTLDDLC